MTIVINREFNAPLQRVWHAWTEEKDLTSWLTKKATVRAELGGSYELFWEPENPERNSTLGCKITALEPEKLLRFTWRGPPQYAHLMNVGDPPPTFVVVKFENNNGMTKVHFEHDGWGEGKDWTNARSWQEKAWLGAFEQLTKMLSTEKMDRPHG